MDTLQDSDTPVLDSDPPPELKREEAQDPSHGMTHDGTHPVTHDVTHEVTHEVTHDVAPDMGHDIAQDLTLELRVLTGLQAGAALPFDQALLVGHADDCDLLLLDDLAPPHLLEITPMEGDAFTLTPLDEGVILSDGTPLIDPVSLRPGEVFGIDGLWLEVQSSEAPWAPVSESAGLPAMPSEEPGSDADAWEAGERATQTQTQTQRPAWHGERRLTEPGNASEHAEGGGTTNPRPETRATPGADANPAAVDFGDWMKDADGEDSPWRMDPSERRMPGTSAAEAEAVAKRRRWQTLGVMGVGALLTLSGLTAMAVQWNLGEGQGDPSHSASSASGGTQTPASRGGDRRVSSNLNSDVGSDIRHDLSRNASSHASRDAAPAASPDRRAASPGSATPDGAGAATRTPAGIASIASTAGTATSPDTLSVPPERPGRVRVTAGVTIVRADTDIVLPFEVREVVLGARSRVVLSSGQTLLPGDAVGRWRLMDIKPGTLVFEGPQRVLLPW